MACRDGFRYQTMHLLPTTTTLVMCGISSNRFLAAIGSKSHQLVSAQMIVGTTNAINDGITCQQSGWRNGRRCRLSG